jgi:hypothetical protein
MSNKRTFPVVAMFFLVAAVFIIAAMALFVPIQKKIDDFHLAKFAQKIAATDHAVASQWTLYPSRKMMSLSLTGENAKRVVQAVSSARSGRPPLGMAWANMDLVTATFFGSTNTLGEILIDDGELFKADGRECRDVSFKLDGDGGSGVLRDLCSTWEDGSRGRDERA